MSLLHVRVVSPARLSHEVEAILSRQPGATSIIVLPSVARAPGGDLFQADLARECVQHVVSELRELGIDRIAVSELGQRPRAGECDWYSPALSAIVRASAWCPSEWPGQHSKRCI
jgi:hypothetical protein